MYKLKNIALHNWYSFYALDIRVCGTMALIGPPGSGKSALEDALQCVFTGNNRRFMRLNAAAGADKERSERTVSGYCLGEIADPNVKTEPRSKAETTVVLTFQDTVTGHCVSCGVLIKAARGQQEEVTKFVARGYDFTMAAFLERDGDETFVVPHARMVADMRAADPAAFKVHQGKERYTEDFLRAMQPSATPSTDKVLRAVMSAVNLKTIEDPTEFGQRFILPEVLVDTQVASDRIKKWRELDARTESIERELDAAEEAAGALAAHFNLKARFGASQWRMAEAMRRVKSSEADACQDSLDAATAHLESVRAREADAQVRREANEAEARAKIAEINRSGVTDRTAVIKERIAGEERGQRDHARRVRQGLDTVASASFLENLSGYLADRHVKAAREAAPLLRRTPEETDALCADAAGFAPVLTRVLGVAAAADSLQAQYEARLGDRAGLKKAIEEDERYLAEIQKGMASLPHEVTQLQDALRRAGIETRRLPDVVEVSDGSWAKAVELILGPERLALIVTDPRRSGEAHEILHRLRNDGKLANCRLVLTDREARDQSPSRGSLMDVIETDDPHARSFLSSRLGRVLMAETEADLKRLGNAVMRNGKRTSGMGARVYSDSRFYLYLGRSVSEQDIEDVRQRLATARAALAAEEAAVASLSRGIALCATLAGVDKDELVRDMAGLASSSRALAALRADLESAEDPTTKRLTAEIARLDEEKRLIELGMAKLKREGEAIREDMTRHAALRDVRLAEAEALGSEVARIEDAEEEPRLLAAYQLAKADAATAGRSAALAAQVEATGLEGNAALLKVHQDEKEWQFTTLHKGNMRKREGEAANAFMSFLHAYPARGSKAVEQMDGMDRFSWILSLVERIRGNELREYREKVADASRRMEQTLKEGLLIELGAAISSGRTSLRELNRRLERHSFVDGVRYRFKATVKPEHLRFVNLVERMHKAKTVGEAPLLNGEGETLHDLDAEVNSVLADIEMMLGDEASAKVLADYRTYYSFEVEFLTTDGSTVSMARRHSMLSGGQRQAPFYVAIGAALASAYYPHARGDREDRQGCGLAFLDEAFAKLDGPNTARLVDYFKAIGIQLIIAAPDDKRNTFLNCVDGIINIAREPGSATVHVDVEEVGELAKETIRRENPEWRGSAAFREAAE